MMKSRKQDNLPEQRISRRLGINSLIDDVNKDVSRVVSAINKVLFSHKCNLISCKIIHFPDSCGNGQLDKWIKHLLEEKKAQELALTCEDYPDLMIEYATKKLCLSSGIFFGTTLHALELIYYKLETYNISAFDHCHNLKTLKMKRLSLRTKTLEGIISRCACLEHLSLHACTGLSQVRIVNHNIKIVELKFLKVGEINLSTKSLYVLMLDYLKCPAKRLVICAPKLRVFHAYYMLEDEQHPTKFVRHLDE
ncbi:hypothetical protein DITRI_Ditri07aG0006200 [Diplodiscus trichospermus]